MATWRALPGQALGAMVEIREHRSPLCWLTGHSWVWETDTVACSVPRCRATNRQAMEAILDEFASPAGAEVLARELRKRAS